MDFKNKFQLQHIYKNSLWLLVFLVQACDIAGDTKDETLRVTNYRGPFFMVVSALRPNSRLHENPRQTDAMVMENHQSLVMLTADLKRLTKSNRDNLVHTHASANGTTEFRYYEYIKHWRGNMERLGNINYPANLTIPTAPRGDALVDVGIYANGSLHSITIVRSTGGKEIIDTVKNIIHNSPPFQPLGSSVSENGVLHITSVFQFR